MLITFREPGVLVRGGRVNAREAAIDLPRYFPQRMPSFTGIVSPSSYIFLFQVNQAVEAFSCS